MMDDAEHFHASNRAARSWSVSSLFRGSTVGDLYDQYTYVDVKCGWREP